VTGAFYVPKDDKGFVLVLVLATAVLLAIFAAGFSATVRSYVRSGTTRIEVARARAIADGGINLALLDLASARGQLQSNRRFDPEGPAVACEAADGAILTVRITDEAKKINLNTVNQTELVSLFQQLGAGVGEAELYAGNVLDFRDGDDDAWQGGSERAVYAALGPYGSPKNAPFDSVAELTQVAGLPADIAAKAANLMTVHTSAVSIYSWVRMASGVSFVTHAIAVLPLQQRTGYTLVQWRRGDLGDSSGWAVAPGELKPC
jgi:type II secretory pathway component PulK